MMEDSGKVSTAAAPTVSGYPVKLLCQLWVSLGIVFAPSYGLTLALDEL